jgi:hypothetical protein
VGLLKRYPSKKSKRGGVAGTFVAWTMFDSEGQTAMKLEGRMKRFVFLLMFLLIACSAFAGDDAVPEPTQKRWCNLQALQNPKHLHST